MSSRLATVAALLAITVLLCPFISSAEEGVQQTKQDGMLIHISHGADDPHRVLMPLSLALKMSESMVVRVFFDIDGVTLVGKNAKNLTNEGFEKGSNELIQALLANDHVTLHVCPMCLKAAGMTQEDLLDGVQIADPGTFTGFTDGRIVSLDW
jgi:predicted peroxiredoxin